MTYNFPQLVMFRNVIIRHNSDLITTFFTSTKVTGSMSGVVKSMDSALRSMNLEKVGYLLNYSLIYFSWNADRGQDYFLLSLGFWAKNNAEYPYRVPSQYMCEFEFCNLCTAQMNLLINIFSEVFKLSLIHVFSSGICSDGQVWTTVWTSWCTVQLYGKCNEWYHNSLSTTGEDWFVLLAHCNLEL